MISEIEGKIDKVLITKKDTQKIEKWARDNIKWSENGNILDKKKFFPLKTFIFDYVGTKFLVELDDYDPVIGGRISTDEWWYTWRRETRDGGKGFQFDGRGKFDKYVVHNNFKLLIECLLYVCLTVRETEYRVSAFTERKEKPYEYRNRECFLLNDIIRYTGTHQTRHSIRCECWGVRGHIRHYMDGKTVFIEPYKKGRKRDVMEPKAKEYRV